MNMLWDGTDSSAAGSVVCFHHFRFDHSNDKSQTKGKMTCRFLLVVVFLSFVISAWANLEQVNDADLEKLIANEKFVVTLFRTGKL